MDAKERFLKYVERSDECWLWVGAKLPRGYGRFYFNGKPRYAHRVSVELLGGRPVAGDEVVMHRCDTPACVNPAHLSVGSQTDNMRDASAKGRTVNVSDWRGSRNPRAKLTDEQVESLRAGIAAGRKTKDLAAEFQVSRVRVQQVARDVRAKRDGGGWETEVFA